MTQHVPPRPDTSSLSDPHPTGPSPDDVLITAVARPAQHLTGSAVSRGPISVPRHMLMELLADDADVAGPVEPLALLGPLRRVVERAQGRSPADLVALLRLVLVAEARDLVLRCS